MVSRGNHAALAELQGASLDPSSSVPRSLRQDFPQLLWHVAVFTECWGPGEEWCSKTGER